MPLTVSCDALYFPPGEAVDNVLTLKWAKDEPGTHESQLARNSMVLFKLKCSSPSLFHVTPRYGVLPLVNSKGLPLEEPVTATVTIGLHPTALQEYIANGSHGNLGSAMNGGNVSPVSTTNSTATNTTATRRLGPERFAVTYCVIRNQPVSYTEVMQALPGNGSSANAEVARKLWSFIAQKMLAEEYVSATRSISLKVYTENVILPSRQDGGLVQTPTAAAAQTPEAGGSTSSRTTGGVVVSPNARFVECSLSRRLRLGERSHTQSTAGNNVTSGDLTPSTSGHAAQESLPDGLVDSSHVSTARRGAESERTPTRRTRTASHERRSLETEINLLKHEVASSSSVSYSRSMQGALSPSTTTTTTNNNNNNNNNSTSLSSSVAMTNRRSFDSASNASTNNHNHNNNINSVYPSTNHGSPSAQKAAAAANEAKDILMHLPEMDGKGDANSSCGSGGGVVGRVMGNGRHGMKVSLLLCCMFVVYVLTILCRPRGASTHRVHEAHVEYVNQT